MKEKFKDDTFLARWLNGELSPEELAEFEAREDFAQYQKIIGTVEQLEVPARDKKQGWENLQQQIASSKKTEPVTKVRKLGAWKYAAAAAILLLVGYFAFFFTSSGSMEVHTTAFGQKLSLPLPDGSAVRLNAGSKLSYSSADFAKDRRLQLEGEACFFVEKGASYVSKK